MARKNRWSPVRGWPIGDPTCVGTCARIAKVEQYSSIRPLLRRPLVLGAARSRGRLGPPILPSSSIFNLLRSAASPGPSPFLSPSVAVVEISQAAFIPGLSDILYSGGGIPSALPARYVCRTLRNAGRNARRKVQEEIGRERHSPSPVPSLTYWTVYTPSVFIALAAHLEL